MIVTEETLRRIHQELSGRGYLPPHANSKHLRDTQESVRIKFLVTGQFPGDGEPKPISFPDPAKAAVEINGIYYVNLETLISLKIASGLTGQGRAKDIGDVEQLIGNLSLPLELGDRLDPYVREDYRRIWNSMHRQSTRYVRLWQSKWLTADATSMDGMAEKLRSAADELRAMVSDGVTLDPDSSIGNDDALLVTTDPEIAGKYKMIPESDFLPPDDSPMQRTQ